METTITATRTELVQAFKEWNEEEQANTDPERFKTDPSGGENTADELIERLEKLQAK